MSICAISTIIIKERERNLYVKHFIFIYFFCLQVYLMLDIQYCNIL